jgi:hypothetical protein
MVMVAKLPSYSNVINSYGITFAPSWRVSWVCLHNNGRDYGAPIYLHYTSGGSGSANGVVNSNEELFLIREKNINEWYYREVPNCTL